MTGRRQTRRCALGRGVVAFLLPAGMFLAVCAGLRVAPFGSATLLLYDMRSQYVSFYGALKHALTSGQGIYYALGMQLGSSTAGLAAYYLLSPLNLIFLLFPIQSLDVAVTLVTGLKIGLCGLAFCLCARDRGCETPETPLLSLSYALCGYVAVFFHNLMWLDGILLAPVIYAGIRRILEGRGMTLYVVSLAAAIISCYYNRIHALHFFGARLRVCSSIHNGKTEVLRAFCGGFFVGRKPERVRLGSSPVFAAGRQGGLSMACDRPAVSSLGGSASTAHRRLFACRHHLRPA